MPLSTVMRLKVVGTAEALRQIREDRSNIDAELSSLHSEGDPRWVILRQEAEAAERLEESIISRSTRLWEGLVGFVVQGRSAMEVEDRGELVGDPFLWAGYRFHDPSYRVSPLLASLWLDSPFPSELSHPLTDEGVGALLPLWEDRLDEPGGVLLGLHASQGTPFFWERFGHPSHSSAIFGETGSGKTYASAIGWMRLRYFHPDLSVFVLDPLGGLSEVVRAMGGATYRAGTGDIAINPLDPETTAGDSRAKTSRVVLLVKALFPSLTDEEAAVIDSTLSRLYSGRTREGAPLLGDLLDALKGLPSVPPRLATLLESTVRGSLQHLNRPTGMNLSSQLIGFDLSALTPPELPFFLTLLLDFIYGEMRRRTGPKLLVVDEAHYLARNPAVAGFMDYMVRHVRHFNGGLELISQNPEDFLADEHSRSALLNVDSVLLLRLKDGGASIASLIGLRPEEVAWIRRVALPTNSGYAEGLFRTGSLHLPIAMVSTEQENDCLTDAFLKEKEHHRPCKEGIK
jgi:hypothetical protein